ncbi:MAG: type II toxin-antitoxin system HicB family antitoxin [Ginsengibacter sp.]
MKASLELTAVFEEAKEGGYIAFFEKLPGVNTQVDTLSEAKVNLLDALELVMSTQRMLSKKDIGKKNVIKESLVFTSWKQKNL